MKRFLTLILTLATLLALVGCGAANAASDGAEQSGCDPVAEDPCKAHEWTVALTAKDITPTGLTIVCTASADVPEDLLTGSFYVVEECRDGTWGKLDYLIDNVGWTDEGWIIPPNAALEWETNWEWLHGKLPTGEYRIGKELLYRDGSELQRCMHYAYFAIVD